MIEPDESWNDATPQEIPPFTYWPIILGLGLMFISWGVVTIFPIFALGLVMFFIGLGGWISDLREVYYTNNNKNESSDGS
ncbi:MAG TPA: hypothetical protein VE868_11220 [Balneolaceae bacterium]|nr:hypothetical protein [Balneolaceae bacterium]